MRSESPFLTAAITGVREAESIEWRCGAGLQGEESTAVAKDRDYSGKERK